MTRLAQQDFTNNLFRLLKETFEEGGSVFLDKGAGLFQTLDTTEQHVLRLLQRDPPVRICRPEVVRDEIAVGAASVDQPHERLEQSGGTRHLHR